MWCLDGNIQEISYRLLQAQITWLRKQKQYLKCAIYSFLIKPVLLWAPTRIDLTVWKHWLVHFSLCSAKLSTLSYKNWCSWRSLSGHDKLCLTSSGIAPVPHIGSSITSDAWGLHSLSTDKETNNVFHKHFILYHIYLSYASFVTILHASDAPTQQSDIKSAHTTTHLTPSISLLLQGPCIQDPNGQEIIHLNCY